MFASHHTTFLRRILAFDAATCLAMGLLFTIAAEVLSQWFMLPAPVLRIGGFMLLGCAAFIGWVASRPQPPRLLVWTIVAGNALWALESVVMLWSGWLQPNSLGAAFVLAQALAVAAIAELEHIALRRATAQAAS